MTKFEKPTYSLPETCQLLGVGLTTLRGLERQGALRVTRIGRRCFILGTDLAAFFAKMSGAAL